MKWSWLEQVYLPNWHLNSNWKIQRGEGKDLFFSFPRIKVQSTIRQDEFSYFLFFKHPA
jgi:hypothetical protein